MKFFELSLLWTDPCRTCFIKEIICEITLVYAHSHTGRSKIIRAHRSMNNPLTEWLLGPCLIFVYKMNDPLKMTRIRFIDYILTCIMRKWVSKLKVRYKICHIFTIQVPLSLNVKVKSHLYSSKTSWVTFSKTQI